MKRKDAGFSLVEVLVSIVVLALVIVPLCTSLVMCVRMNAKADALLKAQLAVSSTVEQLMAEGITAEMNDTEGVVNVVATLNESNPHYYNVTVSYDDEAKEGEYLVSVETAIRAVSGEGDAS